MLYLLSRGHFLSVDVDLIYMYLNALNLYNPVNSYVCLWTLYAPTVRSNTRKVHSSVTSSAARQLNRRLHQHVGI